MYHGSNPSALRSQKWILEATLSLMEERPFQSITVKEITDRADLSRQTFYKCFSSKEEVLEAHLDSLFAEFQDQVSAEGLHSVQELAQLYFCFYHQNAPFIQLLFQNQLSMLLVRRFAVYLPKMRSRARPAEGSPADFYLEAFLSAGLVGILELYSRSDLASSSEIAAMLENLLNCKL